MKRKMIVLASVFVLISLITSLFAGCSTSKSDDEILNFFMWSEYIPQSVVDEFAEETGIKVNMSYFSSNEEMLAKIQAGTKGAYDLTVASDYMVDIMIKQGDIIEPLDLSKIENSNNINPIYMSQSFDPENEYSIPYMGGAVLLAYNSSKINFVPESFEDLFRPELANDLVVLDDQRAVIGLVLKSLGYSMNETDSSKLEEAKDKLGDLIPNIKAFDSDNPKAKLASGEVSIGYCWSAEVALAMLDNSDIEVAFPKEGTYLFLDNFVIPKDAKNAEAAYKFIEYCLRPEVSAAITEEYPYMNPNKAAQSLLPESYIDNPASNLPDEVFEKGEYILDVGEDTRTYDEIWTAVKG
jgi:spermidine/putrescine transport system substrate-binding protein/spermidine/putrescine transport system permease protein